MSLENDLREKLSLQRKGSIDNGFNMWLKCYHGEPFWIDKKLNKESLNLCASIPSELARLVTIELETSITDKELNTIYQKLIKKIRTITEYALALGGIILKPYKDEENVEVDVVTPDLFVILGFTSFGEINHIAFLDRIEKKEKDNKIYFTRVEEHKIDKIYTITNTAYRSTDSTTLGDRVPLNSIIEWQNIKEAENIKREKPLFVYFKNPMANNLDLRSNDGISCFARALSLIQDADEQYQRIIWEYKGSELAIDADVTVLKNNGELPEGKERLFRSLGKSLEENFYNVFSPSIRDVSLFNGLNEILRQIEFICGLAYGTFSKMEENAKTATEIKMSKQRSFSTVKDIQEELESCLRDFIEIITFWYDVLKIKYDEKYDVTFNFDDSLVIDSETERTVKLQEVSMGIISKEKYLELVYGIEDGENYIAKENQENDIVEEE